MPGLIPHIKLGSASELGKAVAELIGIKPLLDLAKHAGRMEEKFKDSARKDREAEIRHLDETFQATKVKLEAIVAEHADIVCDTPAPMSGEATAEESLSKLRQHFEHRQTEMLAGAKAYLGEAFNYDDRAARQSLSDDVGPALGALDRARIDSLASAARLRRLADIPAGSIHAAEVVANELVNEAKELSALSQQPDVASRVRLYARVAGWLREGVGGNGPESHSALDACPICRGALEGKLDGVTSKPVADHLKEHLASERTFLEKTPEAWAQHALSVLRGSLHGALAAELSVDLPAHPGELIAAALGQELFTAGCFAGCLSSLKGTAEALCETARTRLPAFDEPVPPSLPNGFSGTASSEVERALARLTRAVAFARWRGEHAESCESMVLSVLGRNQSQPVSGEEDARTLTARLFALNQLVKNAAPVREALDHLARMDRTLAERRATEGRLARYAKAAAALSGLSGLTRLVEGQVHALMATLSQATATWRKELYAPAFSNAPEVVSTTVHNDGSLAFTASAHGSEVPAQHVSNASDLRASLLAFLFAYWQHLLKTRGGLSLFLLDEPQELLDSSNERRLANTLPAFAEATGARLVVTTSSRGFGRKLAYAAGKLGRARLDHRKVHPSGPRGSTSYSARSLKPSRKRGRRSRRPKTRTARSRQGTT